MFFLEGGGGPIQINDITDTLRGAGVRVLMKYLDILIQKGQSQKIRERLLNGGTAPLFKVHPGGTVPPIKMHLGRTLNLFDSYS